MERFNVINGKRRSLLQPAYIELITNRKFEKGQFEVVHHLKVMNNEEKVLVNWRVQMLES